MTTTFIAIPYDKNMWNMSLQELGEKYLAPNQLEGRKVVGLSKVYSVIFSKDASEGDDCWMDDDENEMVERCVHHEEFFKQSPSYNDIVQFIKDNTDSDAEASVYESNIRVKHALVLVNK